MTTSLDLYEKRGRDRTEVVDELGGPVVEHVASNVVESKMDGAMDRTSEVIDDTVGTAVDGGVGQASKAVAKGVDKVTPAQD